MLKNKLTILVYFSALFLCGYFLANFNHYLKSQDRDLYKELQDAIEEYTIADDTAVVFQPSWMKGYFTDKYRRAKNLLLLKSFDLRIIEGENIARIWVFSFKEMSEENHRSLLDQGFALMREGKVKTVFLRMYSKTRERHLADLLMENAEAFLIDKNKGRLSAEKKKGAWSFRQHGFNKWMDILRTNLTIGGVKRNCIVLHPYEKGEKYLVFKDILVGEELIIYHGLRDDMVGSKNKSTVDILVKIGGDIVDAFEQENQAGWFKRTIATSRYKGKKKDISFVVSVEEDYQRWFCFFPVNISNAPRKRAS